MAEAPLVQAITLDGSNGFQRRYTVADGTAISKGYILQLSDPSTAAKAGAAGVPIGIAAADKEASDGSTALSVWTAGSFDIRASGAITVGDMVVLAGNNEVKAATEASIASGARFLALGFAEETAVDAEVIKVRVNI